VDATIIAAPSSTKNATGTRDPEMHQTKKGQQWYFGMKGHFGVDSHSKLIHSVEPAEAGRRQFRVARSPSRRRFQNQPYVLVFPAVVGFLAAWAGLQGRPASTPRLPGRRPGGYRGHCGGSPRLRRAGALRAWAVGSAPLAERTKTRTDVRMRFLQDCRGTF
jgi:hypothetical protein